MAHIDQCIPGTQARIISSGVQRVNGKSGYIVEVSRIKRKPLDPLRDRITIDVPGHGDVVLAPEDLEILSP